MGVRLNELLGHAVAGARKNMIRKTDQHLRRKAFVWVRGHVSRGEVVETFRREIWWLFSIVPIYIRETVTDSTL